MQPPQEKNEFSQKSWKILLEIEIFQGFTVYHVIDIGSHILT